MTNNNIFNKILHLTQLSFDIKLTIHIFSLGGADAATPSKVKGWRTSLENKRSSPMPDHILKAFFDGLFAYRDIKLEEGIVVFQFLDAP